MAAFSVCGTRVIGMPEIFTPAPEIPAPAGCGPAGVIAYCTGTGADLGGTRESARELFPSPFTAPPQPAPDPYASLFD